MEHPVMFDADDPLLIDVDRPGTDWDEVAELLDASWRHSAPKRLL